MLQEDYKRDFCEFWDNLGVYINLTSPTTPSGITLHKSSTALVLSVVFATLNFVY